MEGTGNRPDSPGISSSDSQATVVMTTERAWKSIFKAMSRASSTSELYQDLVRLRRTRLTCYICENDIAVDDGYICRCGHRYCVHCLNNLVRFIVACNMRLPEEKTVAETCDIHTPDSREGCCRFCCLPTDYWVEDPDGRRGGGGRLTA